MPAITSIALVNRHPSKALACTVNLSGARLEGQYQATVLAGDSPDACNDMKHPNRVVPERTQLAFKKGVARLVPHSLTVVKVPVI